jgi:hypothetical protein
MNLTIALAVLGVAVLVAIALHGRWQQRKLEPKRAPRVEPGLRKEPTLEPSDGADAPQTAVIGTFPASVGLPRADELQMPSLLRKTVRLDASIDAIVPIALEQAVSGDQAQMHLPTARRAGSKPFSIEGLNAQTGDWEAPMAGRRYSEFQAGVQLANRNGPLNEIEYSEFVQKVQSFADPLGGRVDAPDMLAVVARARELDAFAQDNDAVLSAELRTTGVPWSTSYVEQCAARHGFVAGPIPGRLVLPSAVGDPPLLTLVYDTQAVLADDPARAVVRGATLTLDVPQNAESAEPFEAWHRVATQLARDMQANLVDTEGRPIAEQAFASIGQTLQSLYQRMAARDLAAGSATTRRLFS